MSGPNNARFTAWLSQDERAAITHLAQQLGSSENYVVRLAIRQFTGIEPEPEPSEATTSNASNA